MTHQTGSRSKVVGYRYGAQRFDLVRVEQLLQAALNNGVVTQFVAKRYVDEDVIWFNGRPCKALRAVRNEVLASREPLL